MRDYLQYKGLRPELWPQVKVNKKSNRVEEEGGSIKGKGKQKVIEIKKTSSYMNYLPPACNTLSKEEKRVFCESFYGIKVPSGYLSNVKRFVTLKSDLNLRSMISHDYHVMIQEFLPIAIRGILPNMGDMLLPSYVRS